MFDTGTLRSVRKLLILGVLLFCLGFVTLSRSTSPVKADDCNSAYTYLDVCYDDCAWNGGSTTCYNNCEVAHADYGTTCNLPHYSPMLSSSYSCSRNSDQLLANCIAGQLPPVWQQRYIDQLVLQGGDMDAACTQLVWDYQNQECY
ncbi:MAG TPA: hypothetical protein VF668_24465 [Pyrinomonadaceae bacterium]|jgi:hypothetical protein